MKKKQMYQHSGVDHPQYLNITGQTVFHKIVKFLKERSTWDDGYLELVAAAAACYQTYVQAQLEVLERGATVSTSTGVVKKNPACDVAGSNFRDFMAFSSKFGLNPLFAGKVGAEVEDESEI